MTTMEDLNQTQIILLTLLISFVTSIATGIITTSLLAEAPTSVTQTINRVVEHTIEKVAPAPATGSTVKEVTIVKEEDSIISAISAVSKSIVRLKSPESGIGTADFYALGTIVSANGMVLTDSHSIILNANYSATLPDGSVVVATAVYADDSTNIAVFKLLPDAGHKDFPFLPISKNELKLGQTVIAIEGSTKDTVGLGRVLSTNERSDSGATAVFSVETDINPASETLGSPLVNLSGEFVGLKTSNTDLTVPPGRYTTITPMREVLAKVK